MGEEILMKLLFVIVGCILGLAAVAVVVWKRRDFDWWVWAAGVMSTLGALLVTATPLRNGKTYRVEGGKFLQVESEMS